MPDDLIKRWRQPKPLTVFITEHWQRHPIYKHTIIWPYARNALYCMQTSLLRNNSNICISTAAYVCVASSYMNGMVGTRSAHQALGEDNILICTANRFRELVLEKAAPKKRDYTEI